MTIRELKAAMDGLPDDAKVIVEDYDNGDERYICKISYIRVERKMYDKDEGGGCEEGLVIVINDNE